MAEQQMECIKQAVETNNEKGAESAITILLNSLTDEVSADFISSLTTQIFQNDQFFELMIKAAGIKCFDKFLTTSLQLLHVLVNNFVSQIASYIGKIIRFTLLLIRRNKVDAKSQQKAALLLQLIIEKKVGVTDEILGKVLKDIEIVSIARNISPTLTSVTYPIWGYICKNHRDLIEDPQNITKACIIYLNDAVFSKTGKQSIMQSGYIALSHIFCDENNYNENQLLKVYDILSKHLDLKSECRRHGLREGVQFFSIHGTLFEKSIRKDYNLWENRLKHWVLSQNVDDIRIGHMALNTFYNVLSKSLEETDNYLENQLIYEEMMKNFTETLEDNRSPTIKLCIKGMGYLAHASKIYLSEEEFQNLFILIIQKVEYFHVNQSIPEQNLDKLPDFVETLTKYLQELEEINYNHLTALKKSTVLLIKLFPNLRDTYHKLVIRSIKITFVCVQNSKDFKIEDFLQDVIRQGVLWTCSHNIAQDVEIMNLGEISYKHYLPLWQGLLKEIVDGNISHLIIDELMKSLIYISNKLNLDIKLKDLDTMEAEKVNDIVIFANLSDFYCDLFVYIPEADFKRWFGLLTDHLLRRSIKVPLISGFYKLLAQCLNISNTMNYFSSQRLLRENIRSTFECLKDFLGKLLDKVKDYKNDLLVSMIKMILCAPVAMLDADCTNIFVIAFKLGQNNFEVAHLALESLTRWYKELSPNVTTPLLKRVVPQFDAYLRSQFVTGDTFVVEGRKRKRYSKRVVTIDVQPELLTLQNGMLEFLGMMNGEICSALVSATSEIKTIGCNENMLKVNLPYADGNVSLYVDRFLDRFIFLALDCADRKTRITACELLHSTVMVFLGISVHLGQNSSGAEDNLKKLIASIIQLGCDQDETVQQLFRPLGLQMMHFYSNPKNRASTFTQIVLEALLAGVSNSDNASKRDYSGLLIKEFLMWTQKQTPRKHIKDATFNVDYIIDNLKHFCLHPDSSKRHGASIIFNNVYVELREEEVFLNKYFLDILYAFVMNLQQIDAFDFNPDHLEQVDLCLDRVLRVLIERYTLFERNVSEDLRTIPPKFKGNSMQDATLYILQNCYSLNVHCRRKCMVMITKLPKIDSVMNTLRIEHFSHEHLNFECCKNVDDVLKYYYDLLCLIDGHIFVLQSRYEVDTLNSSLWTILEYFIRNLATKNMDDIRSFLKIDKQGVLIRGVKEEFGNIRSKVMSNLLVLTNCLILHQIDRLSDGFFELLCYFIFNPNAIGIVFDHTQWENEVISLIDLALNLPIDKLDSFRNTLKTFCDTHQIDPKFKPQINVPLKDRQMLYGFILLHEKSQEKLITHKKFNIFPNIEKFMLEESSSTLTHFTSTYKKYLELLLENEFLDDGENYGQLLNCLLDVRQILCIEISVTQELGFCFLETFKDMILQYILKTKNFENFLLHIKDKSDFNLFLKFYTSILDYVQEECNEDLSNALFAFTDKLWITFLDNCSYDKCLNILDRVSKMNHTIKGDSITNCLVSKIPLLKFGHVVHVLCQIVDLLGNVLKSGKIEGIQGAFSQFRSNFESYLLKDSKRIETTLLIKSLITSSFKAKSLDLFIIAMDFHNSFPNNFEIQMDLYKSFINNLNVGLQTLLIDDMFSLNSSASNLSVHLCSLLTYCDYKVFEEFYTKNIRQIIEAFSSGSLENRIASCLFIECLFGRLNTENFKTKSCPITKSLCPNSENGQEMLKKIMGILLGIIKEDFPVNNDPEMIRKYKCSAYNALVSVICNSTQLRTQSKYFEPLLNRFNSNNEDILWSGLVPTNKSFNFDIMVDTIPVKRKMLLNIRTESERSIDETLFIESQHLFKSTLVDDVCRYDMSNAMIRTYETQEEKEITGQKMQIELEQEDINKHECMLNICGLIKHMHDREMLTESPSWIKSFNDFLSSKSVHLNVKYFLCKVVENNQNYLKIYAEILAPNMIDVICDNCGEINSLVHDLLLMFATTWRTFRPGKGKMSKLLRFFIEHIDRSYRNDINKYNLRLFRELIDFDFEVPFDLIDRYLNNTDLNSKKSSMGVHLVNILLINNIKPFQGDLKPFAKKLIHHLNNKHQSVYHACAETTGLLMKYLDDSDHSDLENFIKIVNSKLNPISVSQQNNFAYILEGIVKHYPEFGEKFLNKSMFVITKAPPNFMCMFLRVFIKCVNHITAGDNMIRKLDLLTYLMSNHVEVQVVALELTLQIVQCLSVAQLDDEIIPRVLEFQSSANAVVRSTMYDILMTVYEKFCLSEDEICLVFIKKIKVVLVRGFVDVESEIREKIGLFWINTSISGDLGTKMIFLLEELYDPQNEDIFLSISNYLLLNYIGRDHLEEEIFSRPLYDCEFTDYEVTARWRAQYASMVPILASSVYSQGNLNATQSFKEFEPTMVSQNLATQKSQYLEPPTSSLIVPKLRTEFVDPNLVEITPEYKIRKQRFYKEEQDVRIRINYAQREIKKGETIKEMRKEAKKMKESEVKIFRRYRFGDYPDIQISLSSLLKPLEELAKKDVIISQLLYTSLFDSIFLLAKQDDFLLKVSSSLNAIFTSSVIFNIPLMKSFLQIAIQNTTIKFDPGTIVNVAKNSGNLSLGCLLLEEYILLGVVDENQSESSRNAKKGVAVAQNAENRHWVKLAELYKGLNEWDPVYAIFANKLECPPDASLAIQAERNGDWRIAQKTYAKLLVEDYDADRKDFFYEAYFKCAAELSDWKEVENHVKDTVSGGDNVWRELWSSEWNRDKLLPFYFQAVSRNSLSDHSKKEEIVENVNEFLQDARKKQYLHNNFAEELAFLGVIAFDFNLAKNYLKVFNDNFLNDWRNLNPLFESLRTNCLLNMRNALNLGTFFKEIENISGENAETDVESLISTWEKSFDYEETSFSIVQVESYKIYRSELINLLKYKLFEELKITNVEDIQNLLENINCKLDLYLIHRAINQRNLHVAKKYLAQHSNEMKDTNHSQYAFTNLLMSKLLLLRMDTSPNPKLLTDAFQYLNFAIKHKLPENPQLALWISEHMMNLSDSIFDHHQKGTIDIMTIKDFDQFYSVKKPEDLRKYGSTFVYERLSYLESHLQNFKQYRQQIGAAFVKLAQRVLGNEENHPELIEYTLKAMKYGSQEAILFFPYLLTLEGLSQDEELQGHFVSQCNEVPTWLFIKWIPQLLAYIDSDKGDAISGLIVRIAEEYPNSLIYAYKLSKVKYNLSNEKTLQIVEKLDLLLHNPLVDKMLESLNCVCAPDALMRSALEKLKKSLSSQDSFRQTGEKIMDELFGNSYQYGDINSPKGPVHKYVDKHKAKLSRLTKAVYNVEKLKEDFSNFEMGPLKDPVDLGAYSPWLKHFHASDHDADLELPGQYTGYSRPLVRYHTKISAFSADVSLFHSKRKPILLTIIGSDVKEYKFIVKCGEDLRQDQRIQQLFEIMNEILAADAKCFERKLKISTYKVIPLTSELGLIEWVKDTDVVKSIIKKFGSKKSLMHKLEQTCTAYTDWIAKASSSRKNSNNAYALASLKYNRQETITQYTNLCSRVPWDMFKKSLWNMCLDSENFFAFRHNFVKSYSTMCISNWLLGIGDRHLENFLINVKEGTAMGIDFGLAFGAGTQEQLVPELVPFRLTPQILNLMKPFEEHGLFEETMVCALKALSTNKNSIMATMNIFLLEPTLDWLFYIEDASAWKPDVILKMARAKFEGANPAHIAIEEVKNRTKDTPEVNRIYIDCVKGDERDNIRARLAENLSVNEQVQCLIDQATDPNLLCRMFRGWEPWI